ncbi:hypothetical protein EOI86_10800, partial [Hwanghaeella grinnelliae]
MGTVSGVIGATDADLADPANGEVLTYKVVGENITDNQDGSFTLASGSVVTIDAATGTYEYVPFSAQLGGELPRTHFWHNDSFTIRATDT